jgi:peptidylprolyl isomerase
MSARMRELARDGLVRLYKVWHRVISTAFMAQGGGALDNPIRHAPPTQPLAGGVPRSAATLRLSPGHRDSTSASSIRAPTGRARSSRLSSTACPPRTQPAAAAAIMGDGRVDSWLIHCDRRRRHGAHRRSQFRQRSILHRARRRANI